MKNSKNVILIVTITAITSIILLYTINAVAVGTPRNIKSYDINSNYDNATKDLTGNLVVFILPPAQDKF